MWPQVYWALSKVAYKPSEGEMGALLDATAAALPTAPPVLLATILWALADLEVRHAWACRTLLPLALQQLQRSCKPHVSVAWDASMAGPGFIGC